MRRPFPITNHPFPPFPHAQPHALLSGKSLETHLSEILRDNSGWWQKYQKANRTSDRLVNSQPPAGVTPVEYAKAGARIDNNNQPPKLYHLRNNVCVQSISSFLRVWNSACVRGWGRVSGHVDAFDWQKCAAMVVQLGTHNQTRGVHQLALGYSTADFEQCPESNAVMLNGVNYPRLRRHTMEEMSIASFELMSELARAISGVPVAEQRAKWLNENGKPHRRGVLKQFSHRISKKNIFPGLSINVTKVDHAKTTTEDSVQFHGDTKNCRDDPDCVVARKVVRLDSGETCVVTLIAYSRRICRNTVIRYNASGEIIEAVSRYNQNTAGEITNSNPCRGYADKLGDQGILVYQSTETGKITGAFHGTTAYKSKASSQIRPLAESLLRMQESRPELSSDEHSIEACIYVTTQNDYHIPIMVFNLLADGYELPTRREMEAEGFPWCFGFYGQLQFMQCHLLGSVCKGALNRFQCNASSPKPFKGVLGACLELRDIVKVAKTRAASGSAATRIPARRDGTPNFEEAAKRMHVYAQRLCDHTHPSGKARGYLQCTNAIILAVESGLLDDPALLTVAGINKSASWLTKKGDQKQDLPVDYLRKCVAEGDDDTAALIVCSAARALSVGESPHSIGAGLSYPVVTPGEVENQVCEAKRQRPASDVAPFGSHIYRHRMLRQEDGSFVVGEDVYKVEGGSDGHHITPVSLAVEAFRPKRFKWISKGDRSNLWRWEATDPLRMSQCPPLPIKMGNGNPHTDYKQAMLQHHIKKDEFDATCPGLFSKLLCEPRSDARLELLNQSSALKSLLLGRLACLVRSNSNTKKRKMLSGVLGELLETPGSDETTAPTKQHRPHNHPPFLQPNQLKKSVFVPFYSADGFACLRLVRPLQHIVDMPACLRGVNHTTSNLAFHVTHQYHSPTLLSVAVSHLLSTSTHPGSRSQLNLWKRTPFTFDNRVPLYVGRPSGVERIGARAVPLSSYERATPMTPVDVTGSDQCLYHYRLDEEQFQFPSIPSNTCHGVCLLVDAIAVRYGGVLATIPGKGHLLWFFRTEERARAFFVVSLFIATAGLKTWNSLRKSCQRQSRKADSGPKKTVPGQRIVALVSNDLSVTFAKGYLYVIVDTREDDRGVGGSVVEAFDHPSHYIRLAVPFFASKRGGAVTTRLATTTDRTTLVISPGLLFSAAATRGGSRPHLAGVGASNGGTAAEVTRVAAV